MRLAVYSTIYPAVAPFLKDWHDSLLSQSDLDFDLVIGLDAMMPAQVCAAAGAEVVATWIAGEPGDSPARIRTRALDYVCETYDAIMFFDSDDICLPHRVTRTRTMLERADACGWAMQLVDADGRDMDVRVGMSGDFSLLQGNLYGMSNTAYRTGFVQRALPLPEECVCLDWFLAIMATENGARFAFEDEPALQYRQHGANCASPLPPFTREKILAAADMVVSLLQSVVARLGDGKEYAARLAEVQKFSDVIRSDASVFEKYVNALGDAPLKFWWAQVASRDLEEIWNI